MWTYGLLIGEDLPGLEVSDLWYHATMHDGPSFVVFDVTDPSFSIEIDLLGETLFLEVSNGVVVGIGEEVVDRRMSLSDVILERVHEVRTVALNVGLSSHPVGPEKVQLTFDCSELSTAQNTISAKPLESKGR